MYTTIGNNYKIYVTESRKNRIESYLVTAKIANQQPRMNKSLLKIYDIQCVLYDHRNYQLPGILILKTLSNMTKGRHEQSCY